MEMEIFYFSIIFYIRNGMQTQLFQKCTNLKLMARRAPRRGTGCTAPSSWPRGFSARGQCSSGCRRPFAAASGALLVLILNNIARTRP